jgi:hypothetical protein
MPGITIQDLENAKTDVDHIGTIANSTDLTATDRLGHVKKTLAGLSAEFPAASANAAAAAVSAAAAAVSAQEASDAVDDVTEAGEVALAAARVFTSTADAGVTALSVGDYFYTPSSLDYESLILYKKTGASAWTIIKRFPSVSVLEGLSTADDMEEDDAWFVVDAVGRKPIRVKGTGEFVTTQQGAALLNRRAGGRSSHQINFIDLTGNSNGEGASDNSAVTTAQEHDSVGFARADTAPAAFLPLTVLATAPGGGGRGESPMYGACSHIKQLMLLENGIGYADHDYRLCVANNAYSGYLLTQIASGTVPYTNAVAQATAGAALAAGLGKTFAWQATWVVHGEGDAGADNSVAATAASPTPGATYKGGLKQYAIDRAASAKAATGQSHNHKVILAQVAIRSREIAIAQLQASNESDLIYLAVPTYIFDYDADGTHRPGLSQKWLGEYMGLAYTRVVLDGEDWQPLQPIAHAPLGGTLDIFFNKTGLELDTTWQPAQTNYGFEVLNASNVSQSIASITVIGGARNGVRIKLTSGSFGEGFTYRYGYNSATGKGGFTGGCGNLRDSQGDTMPSSVTGKLMHNPCVIFSNSL